MKIALLSICFWVAIFSADAQLKVANYAFGEPGTDKFEEFSFYINKKKREEISYSYGKDWKTVKLSYVGKEQVNGKNCFKVKFSNNALFYVTPSGNDIIVTNKEGSYNKRFYMVLRRST